MGLTGSTTEEKIWNYLYSDIGNAYGVAGLMGNLYAESALNSKNLQNSQEKKLNYTDASYTAAVDKGAYNNFVKDAAGYGLAQWTFRTRKQALLEYAQKRKASIGDLETQLCFLSEELKSSYNVVYTALKNAKTVKAASDEVLTKFEKPKDQSDTVKAQRAAYSEKYYNTYAAEQKGTDNMSILIGHASISERGTINGSKGDSTGKEVCIRTWYSKPWGYMAIHPNATVREKHAKAVEQACANDNIGYGQGDRNTLNKQAKDTGYNLSKVGKCNCDCSSLQNCAAVASGAAGVTYGSNGWTTSTMKAALQAAGYKIITDTAYLTSADYCVRGAIYVKAGSHTVCGLSNGAKAAQTLAKVGISGMHESNETSSNNGNITYSGKGIGTAVAKSNMHIRSVAAVKDNTSYGTIKKGTAVEVLEILGSGWYKIVWPGASCGYAYTSNVDGAYYTYTANKKASAGRKKPVAAQHKDIALKGSYLTTTNLKMRVNAGKTNKRGVENDVICVIPAGKKVQCYKYYNIAPDGEKWLYVQYRDYTGYCHIGYLKKV